MGSQLCIPFLENAWKVEDSESLAEGVKIVQYGQTNEAIVSRIGDFLRDAKSHSAKRQDWLLACLQSIEKIPTAWVAPLSKWIQTATNDSLVKIAGSIRKAKFADDDRASIAKSLIERAEAILGSAPDSTLAALAANPNNQEPISDACAKVILEQLTSPRAV